MIEVKLKKDFAFLEETLSRCGISGRDKTLWQSCHCYAKNGKVFIGHFKEFFEQRDYRVTFMPEDLVRRDRIINALVEWGVVELVDPLSVVAPCDLPDMGYFKVISRYDLLEWTCKKKFTFGRE